jgi:hypothetical protein
MRVRLAGAVMLLLGAYLAYSCIYEPLAAAARHDDSVSVSIKGAALVPFAVIGGLMAIVLGPKTSLLAGPDKRLTPAGWVFSWG